MIVTPLGHTEFLLDIENRSGENVRILVDTWLSDFSVGDIMERSVKFRLDPPKIETIDVIYISHAHTDHFDPYTLFQIYGPDVPCKRRPILLLPFTLDYLMPLLKKVFPDIRIERMLPGKSIYIRDIEIAGYMLSQGEITNEDDVMMFSASSEKELLFAEIDTFPQEDDRETQEQLYDILTRKSYETVCYLATRNELAGQLPLLDVPIKARSQYRSEYISQRKQELYFSYQKYEYEEFSEMKNIYNIPGFVRGFIGQGIIYPRSFSRDLAAISIFPLDEIASMEGDIAHTCGYDFPQKALLPGRQYQIVDAQIIQGRKVCPIGELLIDHEKGNFDTSDTRVYANFSLMPHPVLDTKELIDTILTILNQRFLPYWSASPVASFRDVLIKNGGTYRIRFLYSENTLKKETQSIIFDYNTLYGYFFHQEDTAHTTPDEEYWLDDILDFLEGKQDLYSNFWHKIDSKKVYRLWTCLGANFLNEDLVLKKYTLHFDRAKNGETIKSWVDPIFQKITTDSTQ